ncbi:jg24701, partial [Pararge aegeria aegeria]
MERRAEAKAQAKQKAEDEEGAAAVFGGPFSAADAQRSGIPIWAACGQEDRCPAAGPGLGRLGPYQKVATKSAHLKGSFVRDLK